MDVASDVYSAEESWKKNMKDVGAKIIVELLRYRADLTQQLRQDIDADQQLKKLFSEFSWRS